MADKEKDKKGSPTIFQIMATKYHLDTKDFINVVKNTVMNTGKDKKPATDAEVAAFLLVAQKYDLDPFKKEIHAFPSNGGVTPIVGIDGYISIMTRRPEYDGMEIEYAEETETMEGAKECPIWCEVKIYRKDCERPTIIREYLDEVYCPPKSGFSGHWQTHTKRGLRHKTIIQCARVAFGLTGIYDEDEGQRIMEAQITEGDAGRPAIEAPEQKVEAAGPVGAAEGPVQQEGDPPKEKRKATATEIRCHELKEILASLSGAHVIYYEIAGGLGSEHVTEMTPEVQAKFVTALVSKIKEIQEDKA